MFIAEARLASRLNHANVVQIFDFDKHEDTYYLAMEYVRGRSLWELRKRAQGALQPHAARAGGAHRRGGRARAALRAPADRERRAAGPGAPRRHAAQRARSPSTAR